MHDFPILVPVFVLAAWTGLILILVATQRIAARLALREFALGESDKVPLKATLANRNYMNLLELPLLFYVICLVGIVTQASSPALLPLAWAYVGLRIVHSLIHVTYNHVFHRFVAFVLGNAVLVALWVVVGMSAFSSA